MQKVPNNFNPLKAVENLVNGKKADNGQNVQNQGEENFFPSSNEQSVNYSSSDDALIQDCLEEAQEQYITESPMPGGLQMITGPNGEKYCVQDEVKNDAEPEQTVVTPETQRTITDVQTITVQDEVSESGEPVANDEVQEAQPQVMKQTITVVETQTVGITDTVLRTVIAGEEGADAPAANDEVQEAQPQVIEQTITVVRTQHVTETPIQGGLQMIIGPNGEKYCVQDEVKNDAEPEQAVVTPETQRIIEEVQTITVQDEVQEAQPQVMKQTITVVETQTVGITDTVLRTVIAGEEGADAPAAND